MLTNIACITGTLISLLTSTQNSVLPPQGYYFIVDGDQKIVIDGDGYYVVEKI